MTQTPHDGEFLAPVSFLPWVQEQTGADAGRSSGQLLNPKVGEAEPRSFEQPDLERPNPGWSASGWSASEQSVSGDDGRESPDTDPEADSEAEQIEHDRVDKVVLNSLRRRGLSEWEVSEILRVNEVPTEAWHDWIDRYRLLGYLDDGRLAEQLVQTHHGRKGLGRQAVARELRARRIDADLIESALAEIDSDDEQERATEIAVKRAGQLSSYDNATVTRRLTGFLMRKGYSSDVVRHAIDAAMADRIGRRGAAGGRVRFQ